jgi:hypothetical protein
MDKYCKYIIILQTIWLIYLLCQPGSPNMNPQLKLHCTPYNLQNLSGQETFQYKNYNKVFHNMSHFDRTRLLD